MRLEPEKQRYQMELHDILKRIDAVPAAEGAAITQLRHEEDDEPYQVWKIDTGGAACRSSSRPRALRRRYTGTSSAF